VARCRVLNRGKLTIVAALRTSRWRGKTGGVTHDDIIARLELVRVEHRDLDHAIAALADLPVPDQLQLARLKKRKLRLRDEIAWLEDHLIPDIIA
jgi:hypothetical protein